MNIHEIVEYCKHFQVEETQDRIAIADDVCEKRFLFTLRWDMEQTVEPVQFSSEILWEHRPKDDLEWTVMLNRQRYLLCLAQAYAITKNQKYLSCFVSTVESFIDSSPLEGSEGKSTWRTLDTGIRANNWVQSLYVLESCGPLPQPFLDKVYDSLRVHIQYLLGCYNLTHFISNWGVLANSGALSAILYLNSKGFAEFMPQMATLCAELTEQIEVQVLDDGVQWEQSPMYHHEVLWCYLESIHQLRSAGLPISSSILTKTHDMCYATLYATKPNHHQLMRSDSDDTDVRDILTLGAYLFLDGQLKYGGYTRLDFDNLWRLDAPALAVYDSIAPRQPDCMSKALESGGSYYMRTGWDNDATFLAFRCGPLGGGHGHADTLHLDLFAGGEDILTDSGRLTYVESEQRLYLKSQFAHNSISVDGKVFSQCLASWKYGKVARALKGQVFENDSYYYVSGAHLGYLEDGVFVSRQIVCIKPNIVVLLDSFYTGGAHSYTQNFHFGCDGTLTLADNSITYQSPKNRAVLQTMGIQPQIVLGQSLRSASYNLPDSGPCAELTHQFPGTAGVITVIAINPAADFVARPLPVMQARGKDQMPPEMAQGLELLYDGEKHTLIFSLADPVGDINLLQAGNCVGYGEVMVFDNENRRTVLSY